jgi:hypothetical protein
VADSPGAALKELREYGWPDLCRPAIGGDFACD